MIQLPPKGIVALAALLCACLGTAHAADPLPATTQIAAAATAPAPTQLTFTVGSNGDIPTAEDLVVTLTDLQVPSALASAGVAVTLNGALVASALLAPPATTASAPIPAAAGQYTLYVFGVPNAGFSVGSFTACIAPKATPSNCIQSASVDGLITAQSTANDPTISTLSTPLLVSTADTYTFNFADLKFPVALATAPNLALFQGSTQVALGITAGSTVTLNPGTYQLLAIAQADPVVKSGLYGVSITGSAASSTPILNMAVPVGLTNAPGSFVNTSTQSVTLKVTDYVFPGALGGASALLTLGGTVVGAASAAGGAQTVSAPAGTLSVWTYGAVGATSGTFSVDVSTGSADLFTVAQGVGPVGAAYAYAFVTPSLTAGSYLATAADLQFPAQLSGLSFAVAQDGVILQQSSTASTLTFSATAGPAVLLVSTQVPVTGGTNGTGLIDVNVQTSGASAQLVYDKTQPVNAAGSLLNSETLTVATAGSFDAALTDLKFPAAFDSLAVVISRGSEVLGKVFGGGTVSFAGTPGEYQLTFVASPSAKQLFGLYSVSVVNSPPPTVTLTSSVATATIGATVQLSWTSTNTTSCMASGGSFTGTEPANSTSPVSVVLAATTTYTLTCTGAGGSAMSSVTVTGTTAPGKSGGGGAIDPLVLTALLGLWVARRRVARL
jgi:hypothetical protein